MLKDDKVQVCINLSCPDVPSKWFQENSHILTNPKQNIDSGMKARHVQVQKAGLECVTLWSLTEKAEGKGKRASPCALESWILPGF